MTRDGETTTTHPQEAAMTPSTTIETQTIECTDAGAISNLAVVAWESDEYRECGRCGQLLGAPGCPVMLDGGRGAWAEPAEWDQQHGCGEWNRVEWQISETVRWAAWREGGPDGAEIDRLRAQAVERLDGRR